MFEEVLRERTRPLRTLGRSLAILFVALQFWNWCADGWCYEYGWPLTLYDWSDARPLPGFEATEGFHVVAFAIDVVVGIVLTAPAVKIADVTIRRFRSNAVRPS